MTMRTTAEMKRLVTLKEFYLYLVHTGVVPVFQVDWFPKRYEPYYWHMSIDKLISEITKLHKRDTAQKLWHKTYAYTWQLEIPDNPNRFNWCEHQFDL